MGLLQRGGAPEGPSCKAAPEKKAKSKRPKDISPTNTAQVSCTTQRALFRIPGAGDPCGEGQLKLKVPISLPYGPNRGPTQSVGKVPCKVNSEPSQLGANLAKWHPLFPRRFETGPLPLTSRSAPETPPKAEHESLRHMGSALRSAVVPFVFKAWEKR